MSVTSAQRNTTHSNHYHTIVIGVGAMGAAACWYLAGRGQSVLGLEQFDIPHTKGSHAGQTRIIRKAYFEHPDYVPLLERAYARWRDFEDHVGTRLYRQTGIVYFGQPDNENIRGIRHAAGIHGIEIEHWRRAQYRSRYPVFTLPDGFDAVFEPDAGFLTPERAVRLYAEDAISKGAVIKTHTPVLSWRKRAGKIDVRTREADYTCDKLIITAGAWASQMIGDLHVPLTVTRQFLTWVAPPDPALFSTGNFPCWFVEDPALGTFYGFPVLPEAEYGQPVGLKLAHHHPGAPCRPEDISAEIPAAEEATLRTFLKRYLPDAGENIVAVKSCLYTSSPDTHFILDHLPGYGNDVTVACGFSGHGFKFVPVVGEILADLAGTGKTDLPVDFLRLARFQSGDDADRRPGQKL